MIKRLKLIMKQNTGMALLLVLCLFALLMGFGASIFFAAVTNVKSAGQESASEQAYLSAQSFCEVITQEIETEGSDVYEKITSLSSADYQANPPADSKLEFTGKLPGGMGTVQGTFVRESEISGVLTVTARVRNEEHESTDQTTGYTLQAAYSRNEEVGADGSTVVASWKFGGYRSK